MSIDPQLFYRYDNRWFTTKLEVFNYMSTLSNPSLHTDDLRCVINKDYGFDNIDWTQEPSGDWEQMCADRMRQIRDAHSKLVLFYSGGSDSQFILNICLKYNIKLDELCNTQIYLKGLDHNWWNFECYDVAVPFVKENCSHIPFNVVQFSDWNLYYSNNSFSAEGRAYERGASIFAQPFTGIIPTVVDSYVKRGFTIIHGCTEPHVFYDKQLKKYYAELWDTENFADRCGSPNIVSFFTDPAVPHLHSKQCHLVKNVLKESNLKDVDSQNNQALYKNLICKVTRNGLRASKSSPQFDKMTKNPIFRTKKQMMFLKEMKNKDERLYQSYRHFLETTFKGVPLYRMPMGALIGKWYLE